jgi:hypothetical protein
MESLNRKAVILTVIILTGVSFAGTYSGGSGTETDPYQIGTVADWQELMADSNDWNANFIMIADINLQGIPLIPVGNDLFEYLPFTGIFDGNGHIIRNAAINMPETNKPEVWHIGLFGIVDSNGQIRNLGVEDANMVGVRDVAGLAGLSAGTITNCYATGKIGIWYGANCAGLVGLNRGIISRCHADCDVNNAGGSGGLVGRNEGGTITDSYAGGTVFGQSMYVGGLVGKNTGYYDENNGILVFGTIVRCYATGSVLSYGSCVGGLVGANPLDDYTGMGLCSVTDCYASGAVTGYGSKVGGLVGENYGYTTNCYAVGAVNGNSNVKGLIGSGWSFRVVNCFWDVETSGRTSSSGGTGLTTAQMKTLSIFTSAGWDFVDTWGIGENQTYPFLRTYSGADLTYDGAVNFNDFAIWADHWLESI